MHLWASKEAKDMQYNIAQPHDTIELVKKVCIQGAAKSNNLLR